MPTSKLITIAFRVPKEKILEIGDLLHSRGISFTIQAPKDAPAPEAQPAKSPTSWPARSRQTRKVGDVRVILYGEEKAFPSVKAAYLASLDELENRRPGTLERLSHIRFKTRYIIARNPEALYVNSPHLAENYAVQLRNVWYVDTNLSNKQVMARLEAACKSAGARFGRDVILNI